MSLRDPLIDGGEGDFQSYLEDTEVETGYSVQHLDLFLSRVYNYYVGRGFFCIVLRNSLNLVTFIFTLLFATFLVSFVDYKVLENTFSWNAAVDLHRPLHPITILCVVVFSLCWVWQFLQFLRHTKHNWEIKRFYSQQLGISEADLQTIEWREVAKKIGTVKRLCRVKDFLTALDISSRIMRKENYLIALINKDLLNLRIPIFGKKPIVTKTIEWSLTYALFNFAFGEDQAQVKEEFLDPKQREKMARSLRARYIFMGFLSLFLAPFIFLALLVYFFFKYGEDLRNTPGSVLGSREWTPLARWKFREFNELPHYLQARLNYSYTPANTYIDQFPINAVTIIARFVAFIAGSGLAVLLLIGLWDEEILLNSEIYGYGPLWYAGILGTIVAVCRSVIPDENALFEPQKNLDEVCSNTHYWPPEWKERAYTFKVRDEFCFLFEYKAVVFIQELLSVIFTPFILIFSLPSSALDVVDFFRDCTVEVPGVGFVCSFSAFTDLQKPPTDLAKSGLGLPSKEMTTNYGKMEKSMLTFKANNPTWTPPTQGEEMFGELSQFMSAEAPNTENPNSYLFNSSPLLSQSMNMLASPMSSMFGGLAGQPAGAPDPKALAFLHRIHQKYQETKTKQSTTMPGPSGSL